MDTCKKDNDDTLLVKVVGKNVPLHKMKKQHERKYVFDF